MESSSLIRWGGLAAMLFSGLFVLGSLLALYLELVTQRSTPGLFIGSIILLSLALPVGMAGFHALQKGNYGRIGRAGFYTVIVALLAVWLGLIPSLLSDGSVSSGLLVLVQVGLVGLLVGFVLYGAATLQAGVLPRWCGIAFIGALLVTVALAFIPPLGQTTALIVFGIVWLALGYALWTRSSVPIHQPRRVR